MSPLALLALAARRLLKRPFRSFLLLQGTVWGVAVAVFPSAVIQGTQEAARLRGARLGADRISVVADPTTETARMLGADDVPALERALADADISLAAAGAVRMLGFPMGAEEEGGRSGVLLGADPGAPAARGHVLAAGRWLDASDDDDACVVEGDVAAWLGRARLSPGDTIELPDRPRPLHVVGVTRPRSPELKRTNDLGFDVDHPMFARVGAGLLLALGIPRVEDDWKRSDRAIYVPRRGDAVDWIFLRTSPERVKEAARVATTTLVARGAAPVTFHPLVLPFLLSGEIDRFETVQHALFLACLTMGAVVMANLGLLAVLRRRREIAVRRVEGATRGDIAGQFLLEGLLLTAAGCALGCGLAMLLAVLRVALEPVTGFSWVFPWGSAAVAVGVALAIGVLASALPAWRAAREDPVLGLADG